MAAMVIPRTGTHPCIRSVNILLMMAAFGAVVGGLWFALPESVHADVPLRIAYPSFPPFHWVKEDGKMAGFFYEIITEAVQRRMGINVLWAAYPWPRCQENLKAGKADAILTVPTNERSAYAVTHRLPFYQKPLNVFTYSGHTRMAEILTLKSVADIKRAGLSVVTYSGNGWHKENLEPLHIKTFEAPNLVNVWKMLAERRGDIVIEWPPGARPDISRAAVSEKIVDTSVVVATMPFHLLIGKESPHVGMLPAFDQTVQRMNQDGTIRRILSTYLTGAAQADSVQE